MTTALMSASISGLRRVAVDAYTLVDVLARAGVNDLCRRYFDALQQLIDVLKTVVKAIRGTRHVALLDEPWDEVVLRIARAKLISIDDRDKIVEYIANVIRCLEKLKKGKDLSSYEVLELRTFLAILIDVAMSYENRVMKRF